MPQYILEIPKEGVLREVLEADLPHYLGNDAKVLDSRVCSLSSKTRRIQLTAHRKPTSTSLKLYKSRHG
jgi:hypothetical protein